MGLCMTGSKDEHVLVIHDARSCHTHATVSRFVRLLGTEPFVFGAFGNLCSFNNARVIHDFAMFGYFVGVEVVLSSYCVGVIVGVMPQ